MTAKLWSFLGTLKVGVDGEALTIVWPPVSLGKAKNGADGDASGLEASGQHEIQASTRAPVA